MEKYHIEGNLIYEVFLKFALYGFSFSDGYTWAVGVLVNIYLLLVFHVGSRS